MIYEPKGKRFNDRGREMLLVEEGPWLGWICCRHPDGQWVTLRRATTEDRQIIQRFISAQELLAKLPVKEIPDALVRYAG